MPDDSIQLLVEYIEKNAQVLDAANKRLDGLDKNLQKVEKDSQASAKSFKMTWTELSSALSIAERGLQYVQLAYDAVITPTIEYANQVRQLSLVSGESAEETSRFIQVLDDFKISSDDALTATRALTKEGYAPNIETLAQLSDQYLALTSAEEKNEFVIKNLGRAGLGWVEVLNKGSDAIREMGDEVSDGLILNQEAIDQAREYELAVDDLSDAWEGFTYQVGTKALPVLTTYVDMLTGSISVTQDFAQNVSDGQGIIDAFRDATDGLSFSIGDYTFTVGDAANATDDLGAANDNLTGSLEDAEAALRAQEQAAKSASDAYRGLLGTMSSINQERENLQESSDKLKDQEADIQDEITRENLAYGELLQIGEQTQEQIDEHIQKNDELIQKLEENRQAQERLTTDAVDASKERIAATVQEGLAKDGINQQEFEFLEKYLVQQGLIAQADADRAIAERAAAEQVIADYEKQNAVLDTTQKQLDALVNGSPYNVVVNIETIGNIPKISTTPHLTPYTGTHEQTGTGPLQGGYAEGGSFIVPGMGTGDRPYMVNLEPGERVDVTPKGKSAGNINIYVTGIMDRQMVNYLAQEIMRVQAA